MKRIYVLPRHAIDGLFEKPTYVGNLFDLSKVAIISIYSYEAGALVTEEFSRQLKSKGCSDTLSLLFGDITEREAIDSKNEKIQSTLFSVEQARQIIEFLDKIKDKKEKDLIVHCDAGVSRSGAVGLFANRYFDLDENEFVKQNPNILPNSYVYYTLYNESGMRKSYEEFWTTEEFLNSGSITLENIF